jgi:hypothetical protein
VLSWPRAVQVIRGGGLSEAEGGGGLSKAEGGGRW